MRPATIVVRSDRASLIDAGPSGVAVFRRARLIPDMAGPLRRTEEMAAVVLAELTEFERQDVCERAGYVRGLTATARATL